MENENKEIETKNKVVEKDIEYVEELENEEIEESYGTKINWKVVYQSENFIIMKQKGLFKNKNKMLGLMEDMRKNNFVFRGTIFNVYLIFEKIYEVK